MSRAMFYRAVRPMFHGILSQAQVDGSHYPQHQHCCSARTRQCWRCSAGATHGWHDLCAVCLRGGMMIDLIWRELETPSGQIGPLGRAYNRAMSGLGHAMLGAAAAGVFDGWGIAFGLAVAVAYWLAKERGDLRRGGALWDGLEDAVLVCIGTYYGPWWWPVVVLACAGYVMAMGARRDGR